MSILFQVFVEGVEGRRNIIDVANKEQEFNNMTTDKFMEMVATKLLKKPVKSRKSNNKTHSSQRKNEPSSPLRNEPE